MSTTAISKRLRKHAALLTTLGAMTSLFAGEAAVSRWNVVDAGASVGGQADCTAVFQKLLDAAGKAGGGVVEVPAGCYRVEGNLRVPANVTLQGIFRVPPNPSSSAKGNLSGSVLNAYAGRGSADGAPFIRLAENNAAVEGLIIAYPEWQQTDVPPVAYPPCIASQNTENVGIRDCCLLNPYEGIRLVRAARHLVRNVTGYPMKRGLFVDECYDIGHVENVHFWPFGKRTQSALNEEDQIDWPKGALLNYVVEAGRRGTGRYLEGWHDAENGTPPFRWSSGASRLRLPVVAGEHYTLTLELKVPEQARSTEAGLYLDGKNIAPLEAGPVLKTELPVSKGDYVELELRCAGWVPAQALPGSGDMRTLGIQLTRISMRAAGAGSDVFDANTGRSSEGK